MNDIILGAKHIMDLNGFDHMLFLVALAAAFDLSKIWRMILLATAFTVGHSLTLLCRPEQHRSFSAGFCAHQKREIGLGAALSN